VSGDVGCGSWWLRERGVEREAVREVVRRERTFLLK
jgi:hypothetical protein